MNLDLLGKNELAELIQLNIENINPVILKTAAHLKEKHYGKSVYMRGLIEFSNYCQNNCYYCGIRQGNKQVKRYRLTKDEILACCHNGHSLGFRTFVLQGGEDAWFTDDKICEIIHAIKQNFPDCALTLSLGEREKKSYQAFFSAGADRYLLRHETANNEHYARLHPAKMSLAKRKQCLYLLKEIGFQVGAGFMVGSPYQTVEHLAEDLLFLKQLQPHMVGIGPFIPAAGTPFAQFNQGSLNLTVLMVALTRILLPKALLPATTALGTIHSQGREMALKAGANVVMPNLSPVATRADYALYDNKICTGDEAAECRGCIERRIQAAGFQLDFGKGDFIDLQSYL